MALMRPKHISWWIYLSRTTKSFCCSRAWTKVIRKCLLLRRVENRVMPSSMLGCVVLVAWRQGWNSYLSRGTSPEDCAWLLHPPQIQFNTSCQEWPIWRTLHLSIIGPQNMHLPLWYQTAWNSLEMCQVDLMSLVYLWVRLKSAAMESSLWTAAICCGLQLDRRRTGVSIKINARLWDLFAVTWKTLPGKTV